MDRITRHASHYYQAPPHPNQIAEAQASLKRGIDEDWHASVQRYPEVLEYFFGLVELTLPAEDERSVKEPPLGSLQHTRKVNRRSSGNGALPGTMPPPPQVAFQEHAALYPQTPPPMPRLDRRTPGPRGPPGYGPPQPPTANYYAPY